jgi:hypothetical protein
VIPVFQTNLIGLTKDEIAAGSWPNFKVGNCLQAAVASLFELPLQRVPHFAAYEDWETRYQAWLRDRGIALDCVAASDYALAGVPLIVTGKSPRGDFNHVVIELDGQLYHDPHPSGAGVYVVADPSRRTLFAKGGLVGPNVPVYPSLALLGGLRRHVGEPARTIQTKAASSALSSAFMTGVA